MRKRKKQQRPSRRLFLLSLACFLCLGMVGGFLGGVYFAREAPGEAGRIADKLREGAAGLERWSRQLWDDAGGRGCKRSRPAPVATSDGAVELFFAPARTHHGRQIEEALLALINGAEESILCAFYDFELENIARALIARHEAGVNVGVVSDSDYDGRPGVTLCIQAGIPVVFDKRSALMHNKFCVVDGRFVWTGSTNITANCMYRNNNNAILIDSPKMAVNFTNEFEEMFLHRQFGAGSPRNTTYPSITVGDIHLETYFAPEDGVAGAVIARLEDSRDEIVFMTFVFTSVPIAEAMAARLDAGARVRGLVERRSAGSRHSRHNYLRERGAEIHVDANAHTMHHKVIVVDGRLVMTGSYNFSANAETRNDENLIMIHCQDIARRFIDEFEAIIP